MSKLLKFVMPFALCCAAVSAEDARPENTSVTFTKLSKSVYLLKGTGGNIAASIGPDGVVLVDSDYAAANSQVMAALAKADVASTTIRYVFNTHYHLDHSDGNAPFARIGATVIAHENVRSRHIKGAAVKVGPFLQAIPPYSPTALPTLTFNKSISLHFNADEIRAEHYSATHTDGDIVVSFREAKVVHMGDIFVRYGFPFIDVPAGGTIDGMISTCEQVLAYAPEGAFIIPGHGEVAEAKDLKEYIDMLKGTRAAVLRAQQQHMSLEQMQRARILSRWEKRYSNQYINADTFIEYIVASVAR
jgi:glyoxylase-like metal-dependent hydrolase (beta-lactamase superfamily II)